MLLDSNILIYATQPNFKSLRQWCLSQKISMSDITRLEVLGYHKLTDEDKQDFFELFHHAEVYTVSPVIIDQAIKLRQQKSMSLGDAIIASTALEYKQTLATRNTDDFKWIEELDLVNPVPDK